VKGERGGVPLKRLVDQLEATIREKWYEKTLLEQPRGGQRAAEEQQDPTIKIEKENPLCGTFRKFRKG